MANIIDASSCRFFLYNLHARNRAKLRYIRCKKLVGEKTPAQESMSDVQVDVYKFLECASLVADN